MITDKEFTIGDRVQILRGHFKDKWGKLVRYEGYGASVEIDGQTYRYIPNEIQTEWFIPAQLLGPNVLITNRQGKRVLVDEESAQMVLDLLNRHP